MAINKVTGFGTTNPVVSLIFCSLNSGNTSPLINCNTVKNANKGFVFSGNNIGAPNLLGTQWMGNTMENLQYGMYLEGTLTTQSVMISGVIGQQGSSVVAMGNSWAGSTWSLPNYNIWTQFSQATLSPVYHFGSWSGMSLYGNPLNWNYSWPHQGIYAIKTTTNLNFYCDWTQNYVDPNPNPIDPNFDGIQAYLSRAQTFHFLRYNQAVRDSSFKLKDWYNWAQTHTNFESISLAKEQIYKGNYNAAQSLLATLTAQNYIEENSLKYYQLYSKYIEHSNEGTNLAALDSTDLATIAQLCPIEYGSSVYEARALYNSIYGVNLNFQNCNETQGARSALNIENDLFENTVGFDVKIFPVPVSNEIHIQSATGREVLDIRILDITNREMFSKQIQTEDHNATFQLGLVTGTYIVRVTNAQGQMVTKKLLVIN